MKQGEIRAHIKKLLGHGAELLKHATPNGFQTLTGQHVYEVPSDKAVEWHARVSTFFSQPGIPPMVRDSYAEATRGGASHVVAVQETLGVLRALDQDLEDGVIDGNTSTIDTMTALTTIISRFHIVARQLRGRHGERPTLNIEDEYDVQDLLHALLRLFFEDIRPEEWTPSYAGSAARMDFLLKREQVVIEVKRARKSLGAKQVGEELLVDIARYQVHPDCKSLICFIYDPEGQIANPRALESDLSKSRAGMSVHVYVKP